MEFNLYVVDSLFLVMQKSAKFHILGSILYFKLIWLYFMICLFNILLIFTQI